MFVYISTNVTWLDEQERRLVNNVKHNCWTDAGCLRQTKKLSTENKRGPIWSGNGHWPV